MKNIFILAYIPFVLMSCVRSNSGDNNLLISQSDSGSKLTSIDTSKVDFCLQKAWKHSEILIDSISSITKKVICILNNLGYNIDSVSNYRGNVKTHTIFLLKDFNKSDFEFCNGVLKIVNFNFAKGKQKILIEEWSYKTNDEAKDCYDKNIALFNRDKFPFSKAERINNFIYYIEFGKQEISKELVKIDSLIKELNKKE